MKTLIFLCQAMASPFLGLAFVFLLPVFGLMAFVWFSIGSMIDGARELWYGAPRAQRA
jgi:hypothetical protein